MQLGQGLLSQEWPTHGPYLGCACVYGEFFRAWCFIAKIKNPSSNLYNCISHESE